MQWFPDPELEKYIREIARLPEMTDEDVDYKRQMHQQQQAMEYAGTQMEMLGMQQKAEMTAQGYTPEQAEMASQQPTPDIEQREMEMQQKQMAMQVPPEDPSEEQAAQAGPGADDHGGEAGPVVPTAGRRRRCGCRTPWPTVTTSGPRNRCGSRTAQPPRCQTEGPAAARGSQEDRDAKKTIGRPAAKKTAKKPPPKKKR